MPGAPAAVPPTTVVRRDPQSDGEARSPEDAEQRAIIRRVRRSQHHVLSLSISVTLSCLVFCMSHTPWDTHTQLMGSPNPRFLFLSYAHVLLCRNG
jgi:hypothetical protein